MSPLLDLDGLASDPALRRLWTRARARLEEADAGLESASISIRAPSDDERRAVELLLGAPLRGTKLIISLGKLDAALRASRLRAGLLDLLSLSGPLRNRAAERSAAAAAEESMWAVASQHRAIAKHPSLGAWLSKLRSSGYLRRIAPNDGDELLTSSLDVLNLLPAEGVSRAVIAGAEFGNAHALDDGEPLARLVVAALAHLEDRPPPARAQERRALWTRWGVLLDSAASSVQVLNLEPRPAGPVTRAVGLYATAAIPVPVTLQMLQAETWEWTEPRSTWVCENGTVLAVAARRLGIRCPPMVCVNGMLSVAARRLLAALTASGSVLHYHGDFDRGGIRIGNVIIGEIGARPWRFGTEDYRRALGHARRSLRLRGRVPTAVWDAGLSNVMQQEGVAIHEEEVLDQLVADIEGTIGA